jgi:hypothetical protein
MSRRVAIVLRGAPGTGKTTVGNILRQHFGYPNTALVTLDNGWVPGEKRFSSQGRYADLFGQPVVLIIELGYGEPAGEKFYGATMNPSEWMHVLEQDGREVVSFMLHIEKVECLRRVTSRGNMAPQYAEAAWDRYAPGGVCSTKKFSSRVGASFVETTLDTQASDKNAIIAQIIKIVGVLG